MRKYFAAATALTLLTPLTQLPLATAQPADDLASRFTLGVMPDTQYYARYGTEKTGDIYGTRFGANPFDAQTEFLASNQDELGLEFVTHLGDVVDEPEDRASWDIASRAMATLDNAGVNYSILPGNHDYTMFDGVSALQTYFPQSRAEAQPTFGGRHESLEIRPGGGDTYAFPGQTVDSEYHIFEAEGQQYLVLALGFRANDEAMAWAQEVIDAHPTLPVILTSHEINNIDEAGNIFYSKQYGQALFDNLIRKNDQIFLTISGHYHGSGYHISTNDAGNQVVNILQDYQRGYLGGNGLMGQLQFDLTNNQLEMTAYSPWARNKQAEQLNRFDQALLTAPHDSYAIDMDFDARFAGFNDAWTKGDENDPNYAETLKRTVLDGFTPHTITEADKPKNSDDYVKVEGTAAHWRPGHASFEGTQLDDASSAPAGTTIPDVAHGQNFTRVDYRDGTGAESVTYSKDVHPLSADTGSLRWAKPAGKDAVSWFETATGADINSTSFPDGYTLEAFVKVDEAFTGADNGNAAALIRDASGADVAAGTTAPGTPAPGTPGADPAKPDQDPAQTLNLSGVRELRWRSIGENGETLVNRSHEIPKGDWVHVAVVNNPADASVTMYIDGAPVLRDGTGPVGLAGEDVKWLLGTSAVGNEKQNGWVGNIGEIRLVDHPIGQDQWLTARAGDHAPAPAPSPTPTPEPAPEPQPAPEQPAPAPAPGDEASDGSSASGMLAGLLGAVRAAIARLGGALGDFAARFGNS